MKWTILLMLCLAPTALFAAEDCSKLGGVCKAACGQGEEPESGAFEDCTEQQQCCVAQSGSSGTVKCCVLSFEQARFGPSNCVLPQQSACPKGSGSKMDCASLAMCQ